MKSRTHADVLERDDAGYVDPVIEAYKPGVDRTIIRANLRLTLDQRLDALTRLMRDIEAMQEAGRRARAARGEPR